MCYFCKFLHREIAVTNDDYANLAPVAQFMLALLSNEGARNLDLEEGVNQLRDLARADNPDPDSWALGSLIAFQKFQVEVIRLAAINREAAQQQAREGLREDAAMPLESAQLSPEELAALNALNERMTAIAVELAGVNSKQIRQLHNRLRLSRSGGVLMALARAGDTIRKLYNS